MIKVTKPPESGKNVNGYYRKWPDGTLECWVRLDLPAPTLSGDAIHKIYLFDVWTYPVKFIENPVISLNSQSSLDYAYASQYGMIRDTEKISTLVFLRDGPVNDGTMIGVSIRAIGRWK